MPLPPTPEPNDLSAILTNLGVLIVAAGAAVTGILQGIKNSKSLTKTDPKSEKEQRVQVLSATITETQTLRDFTESNRQVAEQLRSLCARLEEVIEGLREHRSITRDFTDETHKLRLALSDVYEIAKAFRK